MLERLPGPYRATRPFASNAQPCVSDTATCTGTYPRPVHRPRVTGLSSLLSTSSTQSRSQQAIHRCSSSTQPTSPVNAKPTTRASWRSATAQSRDACQHKKPPSRTIPQDRGGRPEPPAVACHPAIFLKINSARRQHRGAGMRASTRARTRAPRASRRREDRRSRRSERSFRRACDMRRRPSSLACEI